MPRVALVTGGAGGIGRAISIALAAAGNRVAVADLEGTATDAVAAEVDGLAVTLDVTNVESVAAAGRIVEAELGRVEVLVNSAGWDEMRPFLETDEAFTRKVLEINLVGPMRVTRLVLGGMVEQGWGRIVNVASDAGRVGSSLEAVYSAAKGGLIAFTKTIAREVARASVSANSVCPGPTDTPLLGAVAAPLPDGERVIEAMARAVPMRRLGQPGDVAAAVAFLASEDAGYITGQTLSVSGGLTMV